MSPEQKTVDPTLCPLCGKNNSCGNLDPADDSPCWCAEPDLKFSDDLLNQIPEEARGRACVCRACVCRN